MNSLAQLYYLIKSDPYACSFQTMGSYRSALLKNIERLAKEEQPEPNAWTPYFITPERVGVYERKYNDSSDVFYCYWDGEKWSKWHHTPEEVLESTNFEPSDYQYLSWREL